MPDPHFAARILITHGRHNIQDERMNPDYGWPPCVPLQIIPHSTPNSDHILQPLNKVGRQWPLLQQNSPPMGDLKLRLPFPLFARTLTLLQTGGHFLQCSLCPGKLCQKMLSSFFIHWLPQRKSVEHLPCALLSDVHPGFLGLKFVQFIRLSLRNRILWQMLNAKWGNKWNIYLEFRNRNKSQICKSWHSSNITKSITITKYLY